MVREFCAVSRHCACVLSCSVMSDSAIPWTVAHQAPLSMGFSRQECWSGLPCPPPGGLPDPGMEPAPLMSPALAGVFFTTGAPWVCANLWQAQLDPNTGGKASPCPENQGLSPMPPAETESDWFSRHPPPSQGARLCLWPLQPQRVCSSRAYFQGVFTSCCPCLC